MAWRVLRNVGIALVAWGVLVNLRDIRLGRDAAQRAFGALRAKK